MKRIFKLLLVAVGFLTHTTASAQSVRFDMNPDLRAAIDDQKAELDQLKSTICDKVDALTQDVIKNASGVLVYPNWVRFEQIARKIEDLNITWNNAYGDALDLLVVKAINSGATDVQAGDELGEGFLADIIEEQHLVYSADMASVCFEEKFDFESLRKCLEGQEDAWLDEQGSSFEPENAPTI